MSNEQSVFEPLRLYCISVFQCHTSHLFMQLFQFVRYFTFSKILLFRYQTHSFSVLSRLYCISIFQCHTSHLFMQLFQFVRYFTFSKILLFRYQTHSFSMLDSTCIYQVRFLCLIAYVFAKSVFHV